jgi:hypothetical protein
MQGMEAYLGRSALDDVDTIEASTSSARVISQFVEMIEGCGFYACIIAGIPRSGQILRQLTLSNGWLVKWFGLYSKKNVAEVDLIPRHCLQTLNPFAWISFYRQVGLNRPTRIWQGPDSVSRRILPDISFPPRPAVQPTR